MAFSTQQQIDIAGIKDGVVIMRDGSYRLVLQVTATNFALKSENEQNALIFQYQSFLNSLHFPIEIVVRSKRLDLTPYLAKIQALSDKQSSELTRMLANDYIDFVGKLVNVANIMKKTFYVVVSYSVVSVQKVNLFNMLFGQKVQSFDHLKISDEDFKNSTEKLLENANIIAGGLGSMGLHCFQLSTEQIIELFYQIYNPAESSKERLENASVLSSEVVSVKQAEVAAETGEPTADSSMIDNTHIVTQTIEQEAKIRKATGQVEQPEAPVTNIPPQNQAQPQASTTGSEQKAAAPTDQSNQTSTGDKNGGQ